MPTLRILRNSIDDKKPCREATPRRFTRPKALSARLAWAIGQEHQGTMVGGLVNLALLLALTFWPGADSEGSHTSPFRPPARAVSKPSTSDQRLVRVSQGGRQTWS